ncbi:HET-C-related protein [Pseudomonas abietaniphila]|uniref:HET-C-related protein n=1 Tax=Pseudomonas abietaniphila TaxID=89065 RepID=UPI0007815E74|nr:HET-C-related protein [Pseudomonas abietaniphila]
MHVQDTYARRFPARKARQITDHVTGKSCARRENLVIHSDFALRQLTALATHTSPCEFALQMAAIFGYDLDIKTYSALHSAILSGGVQNPAYQVVACATAHADYDNLDRTIRIHRPALLRALQSPDSLGELAAILMHEFGHHLDNLLRTELSDQKRSAAPYDTDAQGEEGLRYARHMALFQWPEANKMVELATCLDKASGNTTLLSIDYAAAMQQVIAHQPPEDNRPSTSGGGQRESFEAGNTEKGHTHETINDVVYDIMGGPLVAQAIYFGNWLQDYSQLLDPKIVRATSMPKNFPDVLSREALTKIVGVLATAKFRHRAPERGSFVVTPEVLGVYRPSEHIDNPSVTDPSPADPTTRDKDFEPWTLKGDPILEVDYDTSMKKYIQRSADAMKVRMVRSFELREHGSPDDNNVINGMREFGAALHILEDYFAHSNFAELSLIKAGHTNVLPWTTPAECKAGLPVVTGRFGGADVIASLAAPLAKMLFKPKDLVFKPTVEGERTEQDRIIQIMLSEHANPTYLEAFESYLKFRDAWASMPGSRYLELASWAMALPAQPLKNAYAQAMRDFFTLLGNSIGESQSLIEGDPNTDPTFEVSHSQLAKDHAEHPLHDLAARLAKEAVGQVTRATLARWLGEPTDDPVELAASFLCHPQDSTWQDAIVERWALENPELVARAEVLSELEDAHRKVGKSIGDGMLRLQADMNFALNFYFGKDGDSTAFSKLLLKLLGINKFPFK